MNDHPLRHFRKAAGKTLDKLATDLGISAATLSRLETGKQGASLPLAIKIMTLTDGAVKASDLTATEPDALPEQTAVAS